MELFVGKIKGLCPTVDMQLTRYAARLYIHATLQGDKSQISECGDAV